MFGFGIQLPIDSMKGLLELALRLKQSFHRFDDNLIEEVLRYLSIGDKFRFECLSKRIQSLIFNKHIRLTIGRPDVNRRQLFVQTANELKLVLKKLRFVTTIEINGALTVDGKLLRVIADNCRLLSRLSIGILTSCQIIDDKDIVYFGKKCGLRLRSLKLMNKLCESKVEILLSYTKRLTDTDLNLSLLLDCDPYRRDLPLLLIEYSSGDHYFHHDFHLDQLERFAVIYQTSIVKLNLALNHFPAEMCRKALILITQFYNLRELCLRSGRQVVAVEHIGLGFRAIAHNCKLLTRLSVKLSVEFTETFRRDHYLSIFGEFERIVSLNISLHDLMDCKCLPTTVLYSLKSSNDFLFVFGSIIRLRFLSKLRHLSIRLDLLTDQWLENIALFLPQLESLNLFFSHQMSDHLFEYLSELHRLKSLKVCTKFNGKVSKQVVNRFMDSGQHLRRIWVEVRQPNEDLDLIELFRSPAQKSPLIVYHLSAPKDFFANNLPENIRLIESKDRYSHQFY